ncbi:MAG TPA: antitoxin Xre/MbcA/ParS toxin-binding domain-containing protein [Chitinophagales bacterium]|nr:antitoxin Xre/MbcA/ParS toxin-binding domain-containing protein [Chitinophagales bacterium]
MRELKTLNKESPSTLFKPYEKNIRHLQNIVLAAKKGVSAKAFFDVASVSGIEKNKLAGLLNVSLKSLNRYRQQHKKLSPGKSERVLKLMRLYRKGEEIFGNVNEFRKWIDEPAYGLGNMIPETLLETSGGIDLIMEELTRIEFGDLA